MERLGIKRFIAVGTLSALGLTACGAEPSADSVDQKAEKKVGVHYTYTTDGKRLSRFSGPEYLTDVVAFCDGDDLVEITERSRYGGGSIERSTSHQACEDGQLTPEDF